MCWQVLKTTDAIQTQMRLATLPTVADMFSEVNSRYEAKRAERARALAALSATEIELAELYRERSSMAQCVLQQLGTDSEGRSAAPLVAEYLAAQDPAAAASFSEAARG